MVIVLLRLNTKTTWLGWGLGLKRVCEINYATFDYTLKFMSTGWKSCDLDGDFSHFLYFHAKREPSRNDAPGAPWAS